MYVPPTRTARSELNCFKQSSSATYTYVPGANQYASASSLGMSGSNAYVSPSATTSWKMFQIASRSASVAGRMFMLSTDIVWQSLLLSQFQSYRSSNEAATAASFCSDRSGIVATKA